MAKTNTTLTFTPEQVRALRTLVYDYHLDMLRDHVRLAEHPEWLKDGVLARSERELAAATALLDLVYPD